MQPSDVVSMGLFAVLSLALLSIAQSAPAFSNTTESDLEEMFSLIEKLSETAKKLEESLAESEQSTENSEKNLIAEDSAVNELEKQDQETNNIAERQELRSRCNSRYCKGGRPPLKEESDEILSRTIEDGRPPLHEESNELPDKNLEARRPPLTDEETDVRNLDTQEEYIESAQDTAKENARIDELLQALLLLKERQSGN